MGKKSRRTRAKAQEPTRLEMIRNVMKSEQLIRGEAGDAERAQVRAEQEKQRREKPTENQKLIDRMSLENSLEQQRDLIRSLFTNVGIDWKSYEEDPYGDGDQSNLALQASDALYEVLCSKCGDFYQYFVGAEAVVSNFNSTPDVGKLEYLARMLGVNPDDVLARADSFHAATDSVGLSRLAYYCSLPDADKVDEIIRTSTDRGSVERKHLLERRETSFRLTPLMFAVYGYLSLADRLKPGNFGDVVHVLLKYGANPFARDIAGGTVIHYATDVNLCRPSKTTKSLEMAQMCLDASQKYNVIHQKVRLEGLSKAELNGAKGYCGGFDAREGRFVIYLLREDGTMQKRPIAVKVKNVIITSAGNDECSPNRPLVDCQKRGGATALFKVALEGTRRDLATFLIQNGASIDIDVRDGVNTRMSPRSMATGSMQQALLTTLKYCKERPVDAVIRQQIAKLDKKAKMKSGDVMKLSACVLCKRKGETFPCQGCAGMWYCGVACQKKHWQEHKAGCRDTKNILVGPPNEEELAPDLALFCYNRVENTNLDSVSGGYNPPAGLAARGWFWLKVTAFADNYLLCYDESRSCCFVILNGSEGFQATFDLIFPNWEPPYKQLGVGDSDESVDSSVVVRALHFCALFTENGTCMIYPKSARIKGSF